MGGKYGMGGVYRPKGSSRFWLRYSLHGKQIRESSGSSDERAALRLLKKRIAQMENGNLTPREEKVTLKAILDAFVTAGEIAGHRSLKSTRCALKHVREYFNDESRAVDIRTANLREYVAQRQREGAAAASIARELAHLRSSFRLAVSDGRLNHVPVFPRLTVDNARRGFVEIGDFNRIRNALPEHLKDVATFLYFSGWRSGEAKTLQWRDVNESEIRLDSRNSKTGKGRTLPRVGEIAEVIARAEERRRLDCPFVFHRAGEQIGDLRRPWKAAAASVGLTGILPHDLRRSCVRNLVRAGIPDKVAMQFTGHASRDVFNRYNIVSGADLENAADLLAAYLQRQQTAAKVVPLKPSIELAKKSA
jgi:integrase